MTPSRATSASTCSASGATTRILMPYRCSLAAMVSTISGNSRPVSSVNTSMRSPLWAMA
jgi:hypothetical protein